ncbi:bromodomain adjacent to zinc finger domain protein 2B-like isoform X2 [Tachypleus tridentatus]|uniref:bromodomain adjacent to zinc finger domain protein 2B-like isoform X2 n=1 Tax=Tachypleus tridentatus TaxID=6853 RepID=UPI003FD435C4
MDSQCFPKDCKGSATGSHSNDNLTNDCLPADLSTMQNKSEQHTENDDISDVSETFSPISTSPERENNLYKTDFRVASILSQSPSETEKNHSSQSNTPRNAIQKLVITKAQGKYRKKQLEASSVETSSDDTQFDDGSNGSSSRSGCSSGSINGETSENRAEQIQEISSREFEQHQGLKIHLTKTISNQEDKSDGDEYLEPLNLKTKPEYSGVIATVCLASEPSPESDSDSVSAPLDLCIKKHESSAVSSQVQDTASLSNTTLSFGHYPLVSTVVSNQPATAGVLLMPGTRRRGRKPRNQVIQDGQMQQPPESSSIFVSASNNRMTFQPMIHSPNKSASVDMEQLMLPHIPSSRGRPRGRPRGRGRGRGRGRLLSDNYLPVNGDYIPRNQQNRNLPSDSTRNIKSASAMLVTASTASMSGRGIKRQDCEIEGITSKRKRILPDETDLRIPLGHGWRRQTRIRCFSRSGVRGEVVYYTPCGKKLRNYPEVIRYLQRHGITNITRENFTFSTKVNVGEFLEPGPAADQPSYNLLSEQDVVARIEEVRAKKGCLGIQVRQSLQKKEAEQHWEHTELQHRLDQKEKLCHQKEYEKFVKKRENFQLSQLYFEREMKDGHFIEGHRHRNKELERQCIEEHKAKEVMKRQQAAILRQQELHKQKEMILMIGLERERRRQHMLLVRALDFYKRYEKRERKREELLQEKQMYKEKRQEEKKVELQLLREMKKPVDDMLLKDSAHLPTLKRIPGVKVAGKAFANILMVVEFLHNFGDTLGFDMDKLPTLSTLQLGLLNYDDKREKELLSIVRHLLVCVIDDPGIPDCPEAVSILDQKLSDVDVTNNTVSEVLRLFFLSHDHTNKMCKWVTEKPFLSLNPTQKSEIAAFLCNELLCSRVVTKQIESNIEMLSNLRREKWVKEGNLRKLQNIHQTRLFRSYVNMKSSNLSFISNNKEDVKSVHENSKMDVDADQTMDVNGGICVETKLTNSKTLKRTKETKEKTADDVDGNYESGNETDVTQTTSRLSDGEDEEFNISNEELEKKIEKLSKQQSQLRTKLTKATNAIRSTPFGQDRYHRLYWLLPSAGGIFVEGMESAEEPETLGKCSLEVGEDVMSREAGDEQIKNSPLKDSVQLGEVIHMKSEQMDLDNGVSNLDVIKPKLQNIVDMNCLKECIPKQVPERKKEQKVASSELKEIYQFNDNVTDNTCCSNYKQTADTPNLLCVKEDEEIRNKYDICDKNESSAVLKCFSEVNAISETKLSKANEEVINSSKHSFTKNTATSVPSIEQNWLLHSPLFASVLTGSVLMNESLLQDSYFNLPKTDSTVYSPSFSPLLGVVPGFFSAEQLLKNLTEKQPIQKSWFSVIPKVPCDDTLLTEQPPHKYSHSKLSSKSQDIKAIMSDNSYPAAVSTSQSSSSVAMALADFHLEHSPPFMPSPLLKSSIMSSYYGNTENSAVRELSLWSSTVTPTFCSTPSVVPSPNSAAGLVSKKSWSKPNCSIEGSPKIQKILVTENLNQYTTPQEVPAEYRKGWWKITDTEQVKTLLNSLHPRGMRERHLRKQLQKYFTHGNFLGEQKAIDLEITDLDRVISSKPGGAPDSDKEDHWSPKVALEVDLSILKQVEALEEKVAEGSMQIQGWKVPPKLSTDLTVKFKGQDNSVSAIKQRKYFSMELDENTQGEGVEITDFVQKNTSVEEQTQEAVDSVPTTSENDNEKEYTAAVVIESNINLIEVAKSRLLELESAIERRYVMSPLGINSTEMTLSSPHTTSADESQLRVESEDEEPSSGLLHWRAAVKKCHSADQLAMCLNMLEACIAWNKSISRASCQFCHSGSNEETLLLCDGCDKGYHTYCFKPKMETIPDGDWYCYECLNKATCDKVCVLCGKHGELIRCDLCSKVFHIDCVGLLLSRPPKGKWACVSCRPQKTGKQKSVLKEKDKESTQIAKCEKKDKPKLVLKEELAVAMTILEELEKHEYSWPFLFPVNTKHFSTYKKVIKKPMDLSTIRNKLEGRIYKTKESFVDDVQTIFDNCKAFNEDQSPVGKAGHILRSYFERRWAELTST